MSLAIALIPEYLAFKNNKNGRILLSQLCHELVTDADKSQLCYDDCETIQTSFMICIESSDCDTSGLFQDMLNMMRCVTGCIVECKNECIESEIMKSIDDEDEIESSDTISQKQYNEKELSIKRVFLDGVFAHVGKVREGCMRLGISTCCGDEFPHDIQYVLTPISQGYSVDCFASLVALLTGKWCLSLEWLLISLKKGYPVNPSTVPSCVHFSHQSPLKGLHVYVSESLTQQFDSSLQNVVALLERAGGVVICESAKDADVVVCGDDEEVRSERELQKREVVGSLGERIRWDEFVRRVYEVGL